MRPTSSGHTFDHDCHGFWYHPLPLMILGLAHLNMPLADASLMHFFPSPVSLSNALYSSECCYCFYLFLLPLIPFPFVSSPLLLFPFFPIGKPKCLFLVGLLCFVERRLASMLKAFLEPKNISEEQLLNWEQRECPWSADESTLVSDPDRLASDVREILCRKIDIMKLLRS